MAKNELFKKFLSLRDVILIFCCLISFQLFNQHAGSLLKIYLKRELAPNLKYITTIKWLVSQFVGISWTLWNLSRGREAWFYLEAVTSLLVNVVTDAKDLIFLGNCMMSRAEWLSGFVRPCICRAWNSWPFLLFYPVSGWSPGLLRGLCCVNSLAIFFISIASLRFQLCVGSHHFPSHTIASQLVFCIRSFPFPNPLIYIAANLPSGVSCFNIH